MPTTRASAGGADAAARRRALRIGCALFVLALFVALVAVDLTSPHPARQAVLAADATADSTPAGPTDSTTPAAAAGGGIEIVADPATALAPARRLNIDHAKPIFPMQTTPRCDILDNFGDARSGGRSHEGTDIMATLGQEVYAVVDGTLGHQVIDGDANSSLSGNSWRVYAKNSSTYYVFMHLSAFAPGLANGDFVEQGQLIGYVGDTGNPGPGNYHLHFEVHPNGGAAVNALTVLAIPRDCTVT